MFLLPFWQPGHSDIWFPLWGEAFLIPTAFYRFSFFFFLFPFWKDQEAGVWPGEKEMDMAGDLRKSFCSQHVFWDSTGSKGECALYKPENVGSCFDPGGMLQSSAAIRLGSGGRTDTEKALRKGALLKAEASGEKRGRSILFYGGVIFLLYMPVYLAVYPGFLYMMPRKS